MFTRCQLIKKKKHETLCSSIEIQLQRAIGPWLPFYRCLSECSPCLTLEFQEHQNTMFWPQTFLPASSVISTFTICLRDVVNSSLLILSAYWIRFILRRPSQIFSSYIIYITVFWTPVVAFSWKLMTCRLLNYSSVSIWDFYSFHLFIFV